MIIVFDTETTGLTLHPDAPVIKQPKIIEFGAVLLDMKGKVVEECNILLNPREKLDPVITKITGLTDADLEDAATFEEALPQIRRIFSEAHTVFAHNLPFDKALVRGELARINCLDFAWPRNEFCTVGLYKEQWGRNPKLLELYERVVGEPLAQTHRALDDVMALVKIIQLENLWELA
jgi:DNA polymerase III epsilon subunit-like protein